MHVTHHLRIHGRVQGVWYRAWAVDAARRLGLVGWVRNRRDGTVEATVQGNEHDVERFIALAHAGPEQAEVRHIEVSASDPLDLACFEKRETA